MCVELPFTQVHSRIEYGITLYVVVHMTYLFVLITRITYLNTETFLIETLFAFI